MLFDTHTHLEIIDDLENALKRAKEAGVGKIITIGTSLESSKKAIEISDSTSLKLRGAKENFPEIFATCGLHPKDAKKELEKHPFGQCIDTLKQIAKSSDKVVGVGEAGLDYYLEGDKRKETSEKEKEFQKNLFVRQVELAADLNLPLIIHCRNAWDEIFELVRGATSATSRGRSSNLRGVFHSWTGNWQAAQKALDLDFYISFSGIVTFKNAADLKEVAKKMPLERMLIETDSPFLSPEPLRGRTNEPKNVRMITEFLAHLRSQPINTIIGASADNAKGLFGK